MVLHSSFKAFSAEKNLFFGLGIVDLLGLFLNADEASVSSEDLVLDRAFLELLIGDSVFSGLLRSVDGILGS